jgi:hypothetical protein
VNQKKFNNIWASMKNAAWITCGDDKARTGLITRDDAERLYCAGLELLSRIDELERKIENDAETVKRAYDILMQSSEFDYIGEQ